MKLLVLYRPKSEHSTPVETFVRDLQRQHEVEGQIEMISADTREGATTAALYDIWDYPTLIAVDDTGGVLNVWQGEQLPLMSEVVGYLHS